MWTSQVHQGLRLFESNSCETTRQRLLAGNPNELRTERKSCGVVVDSFLNTMKCSRTCAEEVRKTQTARIRNIGDFFNHFFILHQPWIIAHRTSWQCRTLLKEISKIVGITEVGKFWSHNTDPITKKTRWTLIMRTRPCVPSVG